MPKTPTRATPSSFLLLARLLYPARLLSAPHKGLFEGEAPS
jgi:hypothetical protein